MAISVTIFSWPITIDEAAAARGARIVSDNLSRLPNGLTATLADVDPETFRRSLGKWMGNKAQQTVTYGASTMGVLSLALASFNSVLSTLPATKVVALATFWAYLLYATTAGAAGDGGIGVQLHLSGPELDNWALGIAEALGESISGQEIGY